MDDKLSVVTSALESIKNHGWCNIWLGHSEEISIVKNVILNCGYGYTVHRHNNSEQIFVK